MIKKFGSGLAVTSGSLYSIWNECNNWPMR